MARNLTDFLVSPVRAGLTKQAFFLGFRGRKAAIGQASHFAAIFAFRRKTLGHQHPTKPVNYLIHNDFFLTFAAGVPSFTSRQPASITCQPAIN
ncbi:hypothetical protein PE067_02830 [Paracoccus sp. DMF-8]|uniref:hypothetical protein n=1 Tax=Paracoccus sp. DMF-8 TaxID=3019445 RepID=UPI0023E7EEE0|nr:hypothetical protein [Paracoccus sp. DMF-8]MDF3605188.1 hypothetical protein [Paracoccus sp. DMF-8]